MEDFYIDIIIGEGPGARSIKMPLASLHAGGRYHQSRAADRSPARHDSESFIGSSFTAARTLSTIVHQSARILGVEIDDGRRA